MGKHMHSPDIVWFLARVKLPVSVAVGTEIAHKASAAFAARARAWKLSDTAAPPSLKSV
jgi:hypothetical protein